MTACSAVLGIVALKADGFGWSPEASELFAEEVEKHFSDVKFVLPNYYFLLDLNFLLCFRNSVLLHEFGEIYFCVHTDVDM